MISKSGASVKTKRSLSVAMLLALLCASAPHLSAIAAETEIYLGTNDEFSERYRDLTKQALTAGIELERFNLNYSLESSRQPKWRPLRYSIAQETGAAGILTFETIADKQFGRGRKDPARVSQSALRGGLITIIPTSVVAGASSCFELGANVWMAKQNRKRGFDPRSACEYATVKFKHLNELLTEREAFVNAHKDHPAYARAVVEGQILRDLRKAEINEFAHSFANARAGAVNLNTFYVLNAVTNALGAIAGGVAFKSVRQVKYSADADILFTTAGSLGAISPWLSERAASFAASRAWKSVTNRIGQEPGFDATLLAEHRASLQALLSNSQGSLIPTLPAVDRLALYTESNQKFKTQLDSEIATSRHLARVGLQQEFLAPIIGGTLATQGILGTVGYYKYATQPGKQLGLSYGGSVISTAGSSIAVAATAGAFVASLRYQKHLEKKGQSPTQLITARLRHLDEVEKIVQSI
jgi:hypothetical protein